MPGLLARLGALAVPAAAARGSYIAGDVEGKREARAEHRQSMLDQMQAGLAGAQLDETKARGDYYKGLSSDNWSENSLGDIYNKRSGEVHRGSGKSTPHGEEHYDPTRGAPDPVTGKPTGEMGITVINSDGTTGWKKTREATNIDRAKYARMPRDQDQPPPEAKDVVKTREYDLGKKKADDLVSAFLSNHPLEDLTTDNLAIFKGDALDDTERAALGRVRMPPAADRTLSVPQLPSSSSPKIVTPPVVPGATKKKPPTTSFQSAGDYARTQRGQQPQDAQDEADKAALRAAHPDKNEAEITALLGRIRGGVRQPPDDTPDDTY